MHKLDSSLNMEQEQCFQYFKQIADIKNEVTDETEGKTWGRGDFFVAKQGK